MSQSMMEAMFHAAKECREASTVLDRRRVIEAVITEEGWVVRGVYRDARHAFAYSMDMAWSEFELEPRLLVNTVRVVIRTMDEKGENLGAPPVRRGQ